MRRALILALLCMQAVTGTAAGPPAEPPPFTPAPPPTAVLPGLSALDPPVPAPEPLAPLLPLPGVVWPQSLLGTADRPPPAPAPQAEKPPTPVNQPPASQAAAAQPTASEPAPAPPVPALPPAPPTPPARTVVETVPPPPRKPEPAAAPTPRAAEATAAETAGRTVYARTALYVRARPSAESRIVDGLLPGDALRRIGGETDEGWVRVSRDGEVLGWVAARFLTARPPPRRAEDRACVPPDEERATAARVAVGSRGRAVTDAYVRAEPSCSARVIDLLEEGQTVTVTARTGDWYEVRGQGWPRAYVAVPLLAPVRP